MRRHPINVDSHVWCDHHCTIHGADRDWDDEGSVECCRANWRTVYVLGESVEETF